MDPKKKIEDRLQEGLTSGLFTHAYVACGRFAESQARFSGLWQNTKNHASIFDLASLTKALVTGPLVYRFLQSQKLAFDAPIAEWGLSRERLDLQSELWARRTEELLGHYAGLPAWWNFWIGRLDKEASPIDTRERADRIVEVLRRVPLSKPGQDLYSDLGYIILGALLEQVGGRALDEQFSDLKSELGLKDAAIGYPGHFPGGADSFIPTSFCALRQRLLRGEVHDENCAALGGVAGHAGLFATGPDLERFLRRLYEDPKTGAYLNENWELAQRTPHEGLLGLRRGIGPSAQLFAQGRSIGHLGFTGTAFWLDMERRAYGIFLSNRIISGRISSAIQDYRRFIFGCFDEILS